VVEEAGRGEDRDPAGLDLRFGDDALGAAEVVDVAVGVDQAGDGAIAALLAVEGQRRCRGLGGDERVDHDDALASLDHVHVGEVEAAQLEEAGGQLEEAGDAAELRLAPEARLAVGADRRRGSRRTPAPRRPGRFRPRPGVDQRGDEAATRVLEVAHG
jgi:hypothetical protein